MTKILRKDLVKISSLIKNNERVLDVGCGDGNLIHHLSNKKTLNAEELKLLLMVLALA